MFWLVPDQIADQGKHYTACKPCGSPCWTNQGSSDPQRYVLLALSGILFQDKGVK